MMHCRASSTATVESRAPLDVKNTIGRISASRSEDSAARAGDIETIAGALVRPQREDSVVIGTIRSRRRRQASRDIAARLVRCHEVETSIGADVNTCVGVPIQLEVERQSNKRITVVAVTANVSRSRHDRVGARGYGVLVAWARCRRWRWRRCWSR
jgi:hypothetical protein